MSRIVEAPAVPWGASPTAAGNVLPWHVGVPVNADPDLVEHTSYPIDVMLANLAKINIDPRRPTIHGWPVDVRSSPNLNTVRTLSINLIRPPFSAGGSRKPYLQIDAYPQRNKADALVGGFSTSAASVTGLA